MDPDATIRRIRDALLDNDREESVASLRDLADWLEGGGFFPNMIVLANPLVEQQPPDLRVVVEKPFPSAPPESPPPPPHRLPPTQT